MNMSKEYLSYLNDLYKLRQNIDEMIHLEKFTYNQEIIEKLVDKLDKIDKDILIRLDIIKE